MLAYIMVPGIISHGMLTVWYGKKYVVWYVGGMVRWYDVMAIYDMATFPWWYGMFQHNIYKVRKGRIRRTKIICNLTYRPMGSVRKYKSCGQTDRQTDRLTILRLPQQRLSFTN